MKQNIGLNVSNTIHQLYKQEIFKCIERFMSEDFGDEKLLRNDKTFFALLKAFDRPEHKLTAMGYYRLANQRNCVVIYDNKYYQKEKSLIVVSDTDIDLLAEDPLQEIIDRSYKVTYLN